LVGTLASGKEVTKKYILEKYNAKDCRFSTMLRDVLNRVAVPTSRENIQRISTLLRENFGEDIMAKVIALDAKNFDSDVVIVDGVRRPADIKYLNELPNFYLIKINADPELRYKRMLERNENEGDNNKTYEQFLNDENAEADRLIPIVMESAKYSIDNNGTFEELYAQIDKIMEDINKN